MLSWQPAVRVDYQPMQKLRASFKYSAWKQRDQVFNGTIPGFNDTRMQDAPVVSWTTSVNYTLTPTMFIEATYGHSQNELAGCAQAQSATGAIFCNNAGGTAGIQVTPFASLAGANLQRLPFLFPEATVLDPEYYAVEALNQVQPAFWDGNRISKVPTFQWGGRVANAPPTLGFPGWLNINSTHDFAISLTKIKGRHTIKTGFYTTHSYKAEQVGNQAFGTINFQQDAVGTNPFDTSFGFSNAAIGAFSSFQQAQRYVETASVYRNIDFYVQDNWKVSNRLTLDYGMRFVHQGAQYDQLGQASNFLPDRWSLGQAPALYTAGCLTTSPCTGNNRVAVNPLTNQNLGAGSSVAIGTLVPGTGDRLNGLFLPGGDIPKATLRRAGALARAAIRGGVRSHRQPEADRSRRSGTVLRSPVHDGALGRREQPAHIRHRHGAVQPAAVARWWFRAEHFRRSQPYGRQLRLEGAGVDAVERRHAGRAAVGDDRRPLVRRPARLRSPAAGEHQRDRLRRDVPGGEPGSHARRRARRRARPRSRTT